MIYKWIAGLIFCGVVVVTYYYWPRPGTIITAPTKIDKKSMPVDPADRQVRNAVAQQAIGAPELWLSFEGANAASAHDAYADKYLHVMGHVHHLEQFDGKWRIGLYTASGSLGEFSNVWCWMRERPKNVSELPTPLYLVGKCRGRRSLPRVPLGYVVELEDVRIVTPEPR